MNIQENKIPLHFINNNDSVKSNSLERSNFKSNINNNDTI